MEGVLRSGTPPPSVEFGCSNELNRSNSDASTLTAENCEDILNRSANAKPDEKKTWTEEKHSLYLEHLEASFVKRMHQSMRLFAQCSEQNKRGENISQVRPTSVRNASEKLTAVRNGRREKLNCRRGDHLSHVPADSHIPLGKVITSEGLETCLRRTSASSQCHRDLFSLTREGTGQNFVDEDNQNESNTESPRVKRLKTAIVD